MTPCPSRADLQDLLAERLPAGREGPLLAHVETCRACQEALEELTASYATSSCVVAHPDSALPPGEDSPGGDSFWRGLKVAFLRCLPTVLPGPPGGRAAEGEAGTVEAALPERLGRYQLREEIGRGGMGAV